jgi:hypothetical protein
MLFNLIAMMISSLDLLPETWAIPVQSSSRKRTLTDTETFKFNFSPELMETGRSSSFCPLTLLSNPEALTHSLMAILIVQDAKLTHADKNAPRACHFHKPQEMMSVDTHASKMEAGKKECTPECTETSRSSKH